MKKSDLIEENFLEIGKIVAPHGLKGEVRVYPISDSNEFLLNFKNLYLNSGEVKMEVEHSKLHKNIVIFKFKGINDRNEISKYLKKTLYMDKSDIVLEKGRIFVKDLIGLKAYDEDTNEYYGVLFDVTQTAGSDVYNIKSEEGKIYMIPAIDDFIIKIDLENKIIKIRPIDGLLDIND